MKKIINAKNAPMAIGPYSQAVEKNGILYLSGQIPVNPATGLIGTGNISEQTEQVIKNITAILSEAGYNLADIVKSTCMLSDIANFKAMNEVYMKYFSSDPPARSTFAVKDLPLGALIEIETIAIK
jgi:2-iminobutanoate/2-iminopropanoate deaminase